MIIDVDPSGSLSLVDPGNFKGFHIAGQRPANPGDFAGRGVLFDADLGHAWVTPQAVRDLAGESADAEWTAGFEAMVGYAVSKGWTDDDGRIRAHTEWDDTEPRSS